MRKLLGLFCYDSNIFSHFIQFMLLNRLYLFSAMKRTSSHSRWPTDLLIEITFSKAAYILCCFRHTFWVTYVGKSRPYKESMYG